MGFQRGADQGHVYIYIYIRTELVNFDEEGDSQVPGGENPRWRQVEIA